MRNKIAQELLEKTPLDVKIFVDKYADLVVRINQLLKEKGYTQKTLAEKMGKQPSEISKWLNGGHNFTLRSIAKLEAELGEILIAVPKTHVFIGEEGKSFSMTVLKSPKQAKKVAFVEGFVSHSGVAVKNIA